MNKKIIGSIGEKFAKTFLSMQGYSFVVENYTTKFGEIDLIFWDNIADELVFVEVKSRTGYTFGYPTEAITETKKRRIIKSVYVYIEKEVSNKNIKWRIDGIFIIMTSKNEFLYLDHLKNILDG